MRTDSVNLSREALDELRLFIAEQYGQKALPKEERVFKTKSKNAQEAHEAIRPSSVYRTPDQMKKFLIPDQFKLYKLIWQRTVACQMVHATINTVAADLNAGEVAQFRANGSSVVDPGFMAVYLEGRDDGSQEGDDERMLPDLHEGDLVALLKLRDEQHFTEPPPAFTEASLIKALEEFGIGRPSTYATIISTLQQREYVEMDKKKFRPTDLGRVVNRFLTQHFTQYVDYDFTAHLEDDLDAIARGEREWLPLLDQFWQPFHQLVEDKMVNVDRKDVTQEATDEACPKCGQQLSIRLGRRGRFIGCNAYPECDYTRSMEEDGSSSEPELVEGRQCPQCESDLVIKKGRYGKFIGCSAYPNCKFMEPLEKPEDTQVMCPSCQQGNILKRKSRHGKIFFSCARYPECDYALWNMPLAEPCPECHWPILTVKTTKRRGTEKVCPQKECKFSEVVEDNEVLQAEPQE
jgi:DNA topoisomerase I